MSFSKVALTIAGDDWFMSEELSAGISFINDIKSLLVDRIDRPLKDQSYEAILSAMSITLDYDDQLTAYKMPCVTEEMHFLGSIWDEASEEWVVINASIPTDLIPLARVYLDCFNNSYKYIWNLIKYAGTEKAFHRNRVMMFDISRLPNELDQYVTVLLTSRSNYYIKGHSGLMLLTPERHEPTECTGDDLEYQNKLKEIVNTLDIYKLIGKTA